ncbi:hypothetical protein MEA186_35954 [Mesorhizobium amorphae CCNWGS0123]|uniref:Uncharacterized protein n=1 Tax=Mesorhizobium amorphae CCNWGS0123 TaxID=1082933 RepID=G6YMD5_9HYPH|nr:hypothetical protein MEA186_35954 [Mesorhizobium amorphae CCNWGS0123]
MTESSGFAMPPCGVPRVLLLPPHVPFPFTAPLFYRRSQPQLDQSQHVPVDMRRATD